jgi:AcrR family transcriptional regulator
MATRSVRPIHKHPRTSKTGQQAASVQKQAEDRRVMRTRRGLRESLVTLMLERGWDAVTVGDVCEHANVGRSTFYLHYADKENLLLSGFDDLLAALSNLGDDRSRAFSFTEPLMTHAVEHEQLFAAVVGRHAGHQVQWRFRDVLVTLLDTELTRLKVRANVRATTARFLAGGFLEHLTEALETPRQRRRVESFAARFRLLALAVVAAAERLE